MKKNILLYSIAGTVAIIFTLLIFSINKGFFSTGVDLYRILCDSFFATGALYVCLGLLFWVSNQGIFDMLSFGLLKLLDLFKKDVKDTKYASYLEYKEAKKESSIPWVYLVLIGSVFLIIAAIFLILYSRY